MSLSYIVLIIGEIGVLMSVIIPLVVWVKNLVEGQKCQLRNDMLRIYYRNCESKILRQYEYENFVFLYRAYKSLKGNSFIDKIYEEVKTFKVIS